MQAADGSLPCSQQPSCQSVPWARWIYPALFKALSLNSILISYPVYVSPLNAGISLSAHYGVIRCLSSPPPTSTNQYYRLLLSKSNSSLYPFLLFPPYASPLLQDVQNPSGARPVYCLHQIARSLLERGEEASCSEGQTAHAAPNVFCTFQKHYLATRWTLQLL
jgi:hypothetical protein